MTITSKLLVRTLVVLMGLFIFVRGIWLSNQHPLSWLDFFNWFVVVSFLLFCAVYCIFKLVIMVDKPLRDIWSGKK